MTRYWPSGGLNAAAKNAGSPDYFTTTLLYDNVLTGDYQRLKTTPRPFAFGLNAQLFTTLNGPLGVLPPPVPSTCESVHDPVAATQTKSVKNESTTATCDIAVK